ncbi:MAG: LpxL/LpxP family Kdo(2)-lipid IV(A) lauroyl/palmitoleoyl acyltransferase [Pseudomonadota bacterium]
MTMPAPSSARSSSHRSKAPGPTPDLRHPCVWPTWLIIGIAWLLARLPMALLQRLGRALGSVLARLRVRRARIARTNLKLCFPDKNDAALDALTAECLRQLTVGTLELAVTWLRPSYDPRPHTEVIGAEHLEAALATGRGVILVGGHFAVMDMVARPLAAFGSVDLIYRANKDPAWEWIQVYGRQHYFDGIHERSDTRAIIRALKAGRAIWYAADQDYGRKHSVFAPFFGVPAATITAAARLARFNNSVVLMMSQHRHEHPLRWTLRFNAPVEPYPTGDDTADATRLNALLETEVLRAPAQYLWVHKRFKTRPDGKADFYPR